jgi:hypothetical protein
MLLGHARHVLTHHAHELALAVGVEEADLLLQHARIQPHAQPLPHLRGTRQHTSAIRQHTSAYVGIRLFSCCSMPAYSRKRSRCLSYVATSVCGLKVLVRGALSS